MIQTRSLKQFQIGTVLTRTRTMPERAEIEGRRREGSKV